MVYYLFWNFLRLKFFRKRLKFFFPLFGPSLIAFCPRKQPFLRRNPYTEQEPNHLNVTEKTYLKKYF